MSGNIIVNLTDRECAVLAQLSRELELPQDRVLVLALRHYQLSRQPVPPVAVEQQKKPTQTEDDELMAAAPALKAALMKFVAWHDMDHETMKGSEVQEAYEKAIDAAKKALREVM